MTIPDRRGARLLWLLWIVVVLPTALLGTLAAKAVHNRETLLRRQYAERAGEALVAMAEHVRATLEEQARTVTTAIAHAIEHDGTYAHLDRTAQAIADKNTGVAAVVVFMRPWGFVYPADVPAEHVEGFNQALSTGRPVTRDGIGVTWKNATYYLAGIPGREDLYAGFEIDEPALLDVVDRILSDLRNRRYRIRTEFVPHTAPSLRTDDPGYVTVSDSLDGGRTTVIPSRSTAVWQSLADGSMLAAMDLPPPLNHIRITITHPGMAGASSIRFWNRAFQSGIILLAGIICGGSAVILRGALRLARESRRRADLVAGMSHDLKTPITSMRMMAEGLSSGHIADPHKQRVFLDTIAKECERLGDLADRILYFLRRDSETVRYASEPVDIQELTACCASIFGERMGDRVALDIAISPHLPPVRGDREALAKVIGNLLDNAAKYGITPEDRYIGLSAVSSRRRGRDTVEIRVSDHGPGIPPAEQQRVFDRFYRIPSPAHRHIGGIGLGLALCRDIVHAHRGRIRISGTPGKTCVFSVILPAAGKRIRRPPWYCQNLDENV